MSFSQIKQFLLDLLFPIDCLGCGQKDTWLCENCFQKIKILDNNLIPKNNDTLFLDKIISACHYKNSLLEKIIPTFKYKFATELARPLGQILIQTLSKFEIPSETILIPVPLHQKRFNERGFNQAELLAKELSLHFDLLLQTKIISRTKNTEHQARLNRTERLQNLDQCFRCLNPDLVKNKNIILIDDVLTTGSTLNNIAEILKKSGAKEIWGLVVAHE
ncbi:MAG: ComF family protein [Patescibacteria group bacterium]